MKLKKGDVCLIYSEVINMFFIGIFAGYSVPYKSTKPKALFWVSDSVQWFINDGLYVKIGVL